MDTVKIDARDVNFWYGDFHALKGISMQIEEKIGCCFLSDRPVVANLLSSGFSTG